MVISAVWLAIMAAGGDTPSCEASIALQVKTELATIHQGMEIYSSIPEGDRTPDQQALLETTMALLQDRNRPVTQRDLDILDRASTYLSSEADWDRDDDRQCDETDTRRSIFCALWQASHDMSGVYEHRRTALQEVRFIIQDRSAGRDYAHRMQDYNNDPETRFADAVSALTEARANLAERLAGQCPPAD
ncbi:DUF6197 family protein [Maricaulis parjimensis]|uniref:DUF6197 family protein n=1 Tax=Maricaulis parjimensis TaxID=144023 RepID=UPI00193974E5|nr:hypothetical protein [Maricaulis parjimensis]